MLHAILITGADREKTIQFGEKLAGSSFAPQPDVLLLESNTSLGIDAVRSLEKFLSRKPLILPRKIVFIPQAERLTLAAQNALLKTLEEPPANSLLVLAAPNEASLLPTILSRCQSFPLGPTTTDFPSLINTQSSLFDSIVKHSISQRIKLASNYASSSQSASEFCQNQLLYLRHLMISRQDYSHSDLIKKLIFSTQALKQNVNPKLVLENLFLAYPKPQKTDKISQG